MQNVTDIDKMLEKLKANIGGANQTNVLYQPALTINSSLLVMLQQLVLGNIKNRAKYFNDPFSLPTSFCG